LPATPTIPASQTPTASISATPEFTFHRAAAFRRNRGFLFSSWAFVFTSRY
jgi:hypothetical protein